MVMGYFRDNPVLMEGCRQKVRTELKLLLLLLLLLLL
jgi:hypothetical protein